MARFELQGHRGARGLFPENTIIGFGATLAVGVDAIELDVAVTADDVPVVFHDVALNHDLARSPNGAWLTGETRLIRGLTRAALDAFDVGRARPGSATALAHAEQVPQDGARIPTLAEIFAAVGPSGVRVDAELKTLPDRPTDTVGPEAMAAAVMAVWEQAGRPPLNVRSFDWRGLRAMRRGWPDVPLTWLTAPDTVAHPATWWDRPAAASVPAAIAEEAAGAGWQACWAPAHQALTEAEVAEAHRLGLRVVPWTVNAPADMARLIGWGVDGLCTDRPDLARTAMQAAGLDLPPRYFGARRPG